jgi:voltage-gated potassium channel
MTTVGDADYRPITPIGKISGGLIAILGVALFALPTGILASGFAEQMRGNKQKVKCPHCGSEFHHSHSSNL